MKSSILVLLLSGFVAASLPLAPGEVIPIQVDRNKTMVSVSVGGVVIPDIVLDTGFTFEGLMIYSADYLGAMALSGAPEVRIGGAGGGDASRASLLEVTDFFLGPLQMENQRILVLLDDTFKGFPSKGVTGYSIFGSYTTELDYDSLTMTLHDPAGFSPGENWTALPLYFKGNTIPWIDVSLVVEDEPPIPISTYIDFAAGDAILLLERPEMKFRLPKETEEIYIGRGLSGDIYGQSGKIARLMIGPYELKDVRASIADAAVRSKQENADAVLGCQSLRRFNLVFDYANGKLYLKPNSHFSEPFD